MTVTSWVVVSMKVLVSVAKLDVEKIRFVVSVPLIFLVVVKGTIVVFAVVTSTVVPFAFVGRFAGRVVFGNPLVVRFRVVGATVVTLSLPVFPWRSQDERNS